jgi:hypothetical protein
MSAARVCACGCGSSLEGRRENAHYFDGACRVRAHRARKGQGQPEPCTGAVVTLTRSPTQRSDVRRAA